MAIADPVIELKGVTRSFRVGPTWLEILKSIDLQVLAGESISVMGESGSGKSTLMNIIGLLDQPTSGTYTLRGRQIENYSDDELSAIRNEFIGFVFQSFYLMPRLSAIENVAMPLVYRGASVQERNVRALEELERVGLADRASHLPAELSGGQRQRVAIARALVGRPSLILADEPTGALDPRVGAEILELFLDLNKQQGISLIIITHDPAVGAACGRRLFMQDGRLEIVREQASA